MEQGITKTKAWILAARPKTLPAAVGPVLVGSALAFHEDKFNLFFAIAALAVSLLIQIGTNFTNDLYDYLKGADNQERKGPLRVLASGLISVKQMKIGIFLVFFFAFILGLCVVVQTNIFVLYIGITSIIAGMLYTAGPYPLAYHGLGDVFVFLFFGVIATTGSYYIHTLQISITSLLISVPPGLLITNILVVNNFRDAEEDKLANKNTLAVIFGRNFSKFQYIISLIIAYSVTILISIYLKSYYPLLPILTMGMAMSNTRMLYTLKGKELNKTLEMTSKFSGLFSILLAIGIVIK